MADRVLLAYLAVAVLVLAVLVTRRALGHTPPPRDAVARPRGPARDTVFVRAVLWCWRPTAVLTFLLWFSTGSGGPVAWWVWLPLVVWALVAGAALLGQRRPGDG